MVKGWGIILKIVVKSFKLTRIKSFCKDNRVATLPKSYLTGSYSLQKTDGPTQGRPSGGGGKGVITPPPNEGT